MKVSRIASTNLLAALALALACGGVARAADRGEGCWTLRGWAARVDTGNQLFLDLGGERRASFLTSGNGLGASFELRPSCRWGVEVGLVTAELNSLFIFDSVAPEFWGEDRDDVLFSALTLGPVFHLTPGRRWDLYLGPLVALPDFSAGSYRPINMLDGGEPDPSFREEFDAGLALGFQAGIEYRFKEDSPWAVHAGARVLDLEVDTGGALAGTIDVDPTIWTLGVSYSPPGCRECGKEPEDLCAELRARLGELDCALCPDDQACRPPPSCEECRALDCDLCDEEECRELCPPRCEECEPTCEDCEELGCPACPEGQECREWPPSCDEFPQICWPDCAELGCDRPDCPPGQSCRPPCRSLCPPGLDCRPQPSCADLAGLDCCPPPTCADLAGLDCPWPCPPPTCADCRGLDCPGDCPPPPTGWRICCLILVGLVTSWLLWWLFRRRRLPIVWFWLAIVPLVFILGKLWFFKGVVTWAWLWWWLLAGLTLTALFLVLRLLDRKRWVRLVLAAVVGLALLALGEAAAWGWLWWLLLVVAVLLVAGFVWRLARGGAGGPARLILVAALTAALLLLGPMAAFTLAWWLLLAANALLLVWAMWCWLCGREDGGHPGVAPALSVVLLAALIHAGWRVGGAWLCWLALIVAAAVLVWLCRRWIGDRRFTWPILVAVVLVLLLLLGAMAGWSWLWWFVLLGLLLLLVYLLWRLVQPREGPESPAVWLILVAILIAALLLLGGAAGHGWLWWFLLAALVLVLLWAIWRLLGASSRTAWLVPALALVGILIFLGAPAAGGWLAWLLAAILVALIAYWLLRWLGEGDDRDQHLRLCLCLLVFLLLAQLGLGHLSGWSGHWWLVLLGLALLLAWVLRRLAGAGGAAGLARQLWLSLLLVAIVFLVLMAGRAGDSWLWPVLLCALLALLPLAVWALVGGAGPSLGAACAAGVGRLREYQERLGPIADADPRELRDLFLAYRDNRAWPEMYALFEAMPEELRAALEIRQQLAFALNREGRDDEAEELLLGLENESARSPESWGHLGRIYKDRWDAARRLAEPGAEPGESVAGLLERAIDAYLAGHRAGEGAAFYPGINALTLLEFEDERRRELRERLLDEVAEALEKAGIGDYWEEATRVELAVHRDDETAARDALARALELARPRPTACPQVWKVETTCRNLGLLAEARRARGVELPAWAAGVIETLCAGGPPGGGDLLERFLAFRDRGAWEEMYALHRSMPRELRQSRIVRQQLAFALNRDGRDDVAEATLRELLREEGPSAETCGLLGRVHKDRWDAARRRDDAGRAEAELERAINLYLEGHATGEGDPYPGINALTLSLFSDRRRDELGQRLPAELAALLDAGEPTGYWHHATRLELAIHRGSETEAGDALERAVAAARDSGAAHAWMVETTCRNLRLIEEARRERDEVSPAWVAEAIARLAEA